MTVDQELRSIFPPSHPEWRPAAAAEIDQRTDSERYGSRKFRDGGGTDVRSRRSGEVGWRPSEDPLVRTMRCGSWTTSNEVRPARSVNYWPVHTPGLLERAGVQCQGVHFRWVLPVGRFDAASSVRELHGGRTEKDLINRGGEKNQRRGNREPHSHSSGGPKRR